MKTIVRTFSDAEFINNIGFIDVEPAIAFPVAGLLGAYRLKSTLDVSVSNLGGTWEDLSVVGAPEIHPTHVSVGGDGYFRVVPDAYPGGDATILGVMRRSAGEPYGSGLLGRIFGSSGARFCIANTTQSAGAASWRAARSSSAFDASTPLERDRWEFVVATMNQSNQRVSVQIPRTSSIAHGTSPEWDGPIGSFDVGSSVGGYNIKYDIAVAAVYSRALSSQEIADLYSSAKDALAISGLHI